MYVKDYMTSDPLTVSPEILILEARKILREHDFRHLPVTDHKQVLQGIVTDRDIRSALPSSVATPEERERIMERVKGTPVSAIMSESLNTLQIDSTLDDALLLLMHSNVGAVPVIDSENRVKGIFSIRDLMRAYGNLFGLGEKGSSLISIKADNRHDITARAVNILMDHGVDITRIVREECHNGQEALLHIRVNTMNLRAVHQALEAGGLKPVKP